MQEQYLFALHYPGDGVEWGMMMQRFMLALMLVIGGFIAGMQHFAHTIRVNATPVQLQGSIDETGIAVVTGSGGRIEAGLTLLLAGEGGRMLISGIGEGVSKEDILRVATTDAHFSADEVTTLMGCCIDLGLRPAIPAVMLMKPAIGQRPTRSAPSFWSQLIFMCRAHWSSFDARCPNAKSSPMQYQHAGWALMPMAGPNGGNRAFVC